MDSHLYRFHISGASQLLPSCFTGASNSILTSLLSKIAAPSKPVSKLENKQSNKKSSVLRKKAVVNRELSSIHFFFLPRTFVSQILSTIGAFLCFEKNFFVFFKVYLCSFYLFLAVLCLHCCIWDFSSCVERGLLYFVLHGLLIAVASLVEEHRL